MLPGNGPFDSSAAAFEGIPHPLQVLYSYVTGKCGLCQDQQNTLVPVSPMQCQQCQVHAHGTETSPTALWAFELVPVCLVTSPFAFCRRNMEAPGCSSLLAL